MSIAVSSAQSKLIDGFVKGTLYAGCSQTKSSFNNGRVNSVSEEVFSPTNDDPAAENLKNATDDFADCLFEEDTKESEDHLSSDIDDSPTNGLAHAFGSKCNVNTGWRNECNMPYTKTGDTVLCKEKKKKRKKRKGPTRNPCQILAFNHEEATKIENNKSSLGKSKGKVSERDSSIPSSPYDNQPSKPIPMIDIRTKGFYSENDDGSECGNLDRKDALYRRALSFPPSFKLIPALRGGHEKTGMGPRPKLSVHWAPDTHDPQRSSVSHTVRIYPKNRQSKRKDKKSKRKSNYSHNNVAIKIEKLPVNSSDSDFVLASRTLTENCDNEENTTFPSDIQIEDCGIHQSIPVGPLPIAIES